MVQLRLALRHRSTQVALPALEESMSQQAWQRALKAQHCCRQDSLLVALAVRTLYSIGPAVASAGSVEDTGGSARSVSGLQLRSHRAWVEVEEERRCMAGVCTDQMVALLVGIAIRLLVY